MYAFNVTDLPIIKKEYSIIRHSTWQAIDPNHILIYIKEGSCIFEIENIKHTVSPGDCIFIPKNTLYTRYPYEKELCTMLGLHFFQNGTPVTETDLENELSKTKNDLIGNSIVSNNSGLKLNHYYVHTINHLSDFKSSIELLFNTCKSVQSSHRYYSSISSSAFLIQLLAIISNKSIQEFAKKSKEDDLNNTPEKLRRAIFYIQENYYKHISLDDLCAFCYVSKIQLNRIFNTHLNISPVNYIINYKLNKARDLLQNNPNMTVKEISLSVGYEDQCYFSRLFTKCFGVSPSQFRANTLNFDEKKHIIDNS